MGTYNVGPSVRIVARPWGQLILSSPHPIHYGTVAYSAVLARLIAAGDTLPGTPIETFNPRDVTKAIHWLGERIGRQYRADMRSRFTGPQRLAMGRNLCPAHVPCRLPDACPVERTDHSHLCRGVPESPVSVYCTRHDTADRSPHIWGGGP